jgi:PAS domain S-box-containing protein
MRIGEESFDVILNSTTNGIIGIDSDDVIYLINDRALDIFGFKREEIMEKNINSFEIGRKLYPLIKTSKNHVELKYEFNSRIYSVSKQPVMYGEKIGSVAIFNDITDREELSKRVKKDEVYIDILNTIMDTANDWNVVIDSKGYITMMSKGYREFIGIEDAIGKHVTEVIENTRLHQVVKTGIKEIGDVQEIKGNRMVAMRIPVKRDGKIVGAVGKVMFKDIGDFFTLGKKLKNLEKEIEYYKSKLNNDKLAKYSLEDIVGNGEKISLVKSMTLKAARTDSSVLITGESGTGKELFAHAIHNSSKRRLAPFIKINCAAIPSELLESELFGYEEGAFTGAKKGGKEGKFALANGGTILLDEIGDMPLNMQAKLLRVIQEKEVEKIGGSKTTNIDVRIIASTNKNLEEMVKKGEYREDLYYRLNVIRLELPPLRDRQDDIEELANALRKKISDRLGIYVEGFDPDTIDLLKNYSWPGNIRELENVIERAINLLDTDLTIRPSHMPSRITNKSIKSYYSKDLQLKNIIEEVEKEVIEKCLKDNHGNKNKTAKILGISRPGLYMKIDKYNIVSV